MIFGELTSVVKSINVLCLVQGDKKFLFDGKIFKFELANRLNFQYLLKV